MANNTHGYVSTMRCACVDVDAYNRVGIYSTGDIDNGTFVTLTAINKGTDGTVSEFNYTVAPATAETTGDVWLVATPEVGTTPEQQMMSDPRYFYNAAGRPLSLKRLNPKTDIIEVDANCFVSGALPTTETVVGIGAGGKLTASSQAITGKPSFSVVGFNNVAVGGGVMRTVLLQCEAN